MAASERGCCCLVQFYVSQTSLRLPAWKREVLPEFEEVFNDAGGDNGKPRVNKMLTMETEGVRLIAVEHNGAEPFLWWWKQNAEIVENKF